jgi:hypothetical protein
MLMVYAMWVGGVSKCVYLTARFARGAKIAEKKQYFSFAVDPPNRPVDRKDGKGKAFSFAKQSNHL